MSLTRVKCTLRGGGGTLRGGTLGGGGLLDVGYVEGVRWGGGGESGTSTREDRSKIAQKPLKSCLKNRSKSPQEMSGF